MIPTRSPEWARRNGRSALLVAAGKEQWGKLTDDELDQIEGKRDQLVGRLQQSYGITKDEAEERVSDWERRMPM